MSEVHLCGVCGRGLGRHVPDAKAHRRVYHSTLGLRVIKKKSVGVSGCRVQGSGFRVQGSGFRVQGSGFRV